MKIQSILVLIMVLISTYSHGQNDKIYALLTIDDINVEPSFISNCFITIDNQKFELKYKVGRFEISSNDYNILKEKSAVGNLSFLYTATCPEQKSFSYDINFDVKHCFQEYLFIRIFNFNTFPNVFKTNVGYGVEIISPFGASVLPKKTKKIRRNRCLN